MIIYPAIDILGGKAVRLRQGDFDEPSVYADDPLDAAERWAVQGARILHVVDLDGARRGRPASVIFLRRICERLAVPVQYGGGLRSLEHIGTALDAGAERVVLGTVAFSDEALLAQALDRWGKRVAVAVDVRGGYVSTSGWTAGTRTRGEDAIARLRAQGVQTFVYTNVDRDGMLAGPDPEEVARASELAGGERLVYSGGIGSLDDIRALVGLRRANLDGVIVGKALYEGRLELADAQRVADGAEVRQSS